MITTIIETFKFDIPAINIALKNPVYSIIVFIIFIYIYQLNEFIIDIYLECI